MLIGTGQVIIPNLQQQMTIRLSVYILQNISFEHNLHELSQRATT